MTCHSQWPKRAKVSAISKCHQTEWDDDEQDSFLMDVPAKQE